MPHEAASGRVVYVPFVLVFPELLLHEQKFLLLRGQTLVWNRLFALVLVGQELLAAVMVRIRLVRHKRRVQLTLLCLLPVDLLKRVYGKLLTWKTGSDLISSKEGLANESITNILFSSIR